MNETKDYIIKVAFGLFLQKNFKEVTMSEIVKETKLSKGAFYHYFESKEQLLLEILNTLYLDIAMEDYESCSKESLYQFMQDLGKEREKRIQYAKENPLTSFTNPNYYFLLFDGMKLFPDFKDKIHKAQQIEFTTWRDVIRTARERGEIRSEMTDEQIAKIFIYMGDGIGMHLVLENKLDLMVEEASELLNGLYNQFKVGCKE